MPWQGALTGALTGALLTLDRQGLKLTIFVLSFSWFYKKVGWTRVELQTQGKTVNFNIKIAFLPLIELGFFIRASKPL